MFGYVLPSTPTLERRDFAMFQATYCGICMSTKARYGNLPRLTTNYDMTVFELLAIESLKPDIEFGSCRCICDPRKKVYVKDSALSQAIVDANIILCWYKLVDDLADGGGKKRVMRSILKKPYARASAAMPQADKIVGDGYAKLREMETAGVASLDRTSDSFARLLSDLLICVLDKVAAADAKYAERMTAIRSDDNYLLALRTLCYNVGKFVYLADALDDIGEDAAAKRYNPILAVYNDYKKGKKREFVEKHRAELSFAFTSTVNRAIECLNAMPLTHVGDLLRNIIYDGLREKTKQLFSAKGKLKKPVLYAPKAKKD